MSTQTQTEHYFGACPECGGTDGYMNVERVHFFVCDKHKTKWRVGENLFSSWHAETEAEWQSNTERLRLYRKVEPMPWQPTPEEREQLDRAAARPPVMDPLDLDIPF